MNKEELMRILDECVVAGMSISTTIELENDDVRIAEEQSNLQNISMASHKRIVGLLMDAMKSTNEDYVELLAIQANSVESYFEGCCNNL